MTAVAYDLERYPGLVAAVGHFDYHDAFGVESGKDLRRIMAGFFSCRPTWLRLLFLLRAPLARLLGLEHSLEAQRTFTPEEIPFATGESVWIFSVAGAQEDGFWAGEAQDAHLRAVLAFTCEPLGSGRFRHTVLTFVTYKDWRGPVYFNLVRPFHALIIKATLKACA